ncbi:MAG: cell division protein ZapA [Alphaproteobacteria bacterium]|nr:cell division protein ZapA [Alphaproteobacteria bacterium]
MGQVTITIDKREYVIACGDGQEAHIMKLSRILDEKAKQLSANSATINENMKLAMVGLLLADELSDITNGRAVEFDAPDKLQKADAETSRIIDAQTAKIIQIMQSI